MRGRSPGQGGVRPPGRHRRGRADGAAARLHPLHRRHRRLPHPARAACARSCRRCCRRAASGSATSWPARSCSASGAPRRRRWRSGSARRPGWRPTPTTLDVSTRHRRPVRGDPVVPPARPRARARGPRWRWPSAWPTPIADAMHHRPPPGVHPELFLVVRGRRLPAPPRRRRRVAGVRRLARRRRAAPAASRRRHLRRHRLRRRRPPPPPPAHRRLRRRRWPRRRPPGTGRRRPVRTRPPTPEDGPAMPRLALPRPRGQLAAAPRGAWRRWSPALDAGFGNPSGAHALARAGARGARRRPRASWPSVVGCRARRDRVHQRRHRGRQPGRPRGRSARAAGTAVCTRHRAPRGARARRAPAAAASCPSTAAGVVDLDALAARSTTTSRSCRSMLVNNEIGTVQPLDDVADVVRERAPGALLHTDAAQALTLARRRARPPRPPTSSRWRRTSAAARSASVRWSCAPGWPSRRSRSAAGRSASGAAAPRTSPARSASPPPRPPRPTSASALVDAGAGAGATALVDGDRSPPSRAPSRARCPPDRRATTSSPASPTCACPAVDSEALLFLLEHDHRRAGQRRVELRERRPGAVARAGGARASTGRWRPAPCACRWAGRPPRPTSTPPSTAVPAAGRAPAGPRPRRSAGMTRARARRDVGRRRLVGRGAPCSSRPATRWSASPSSSGAASPTPGCCSVADVDDARSVARRLGIEHHVFNFGDDFDEHVVAPYVADHAAGPHAEPVHRVQPPPQVRPPAPPGRRPRLRRRGHRPPRPDRRARRRHPPRRARRRRGQGPVLRRPHARPGDAGPRAVPGRAPHQGRGAGRGRPARAATADKPDSQDVCFITATGGRAGLPRPPHRRPTPARSSTAPATAVGQVAAVELVTIGQRHGLGLAGRHRPALRGRRRRPDRHGHRRRPRPTCSSTDVELDRPRLGRRPRRRDRCSAQTSAHGAPRAVHGRRATWSASTSPTRRVAPGQSVVLYDGDEVVAGGIAR